MIDLVFRNLTADNSFGEEFFNNVLEIATKELNLNKNIGVSVNLMGEKKIQELNLKYRNKDKVTDVLSFPMESESDVGDIFICLEVAKRQAKSENTTIERKLAQLVVHGFLHLLGYDHEKGEDDAQEMFNLEKQILNKISV